MLKVNLLKLMDEGACYDLLREVRWADGLSCVYCNHDEVIKQGLEINGLTQKYCCKNCKRDFNDLTETLFSNSKKSLKVWIVCLYLMSLNISNLQISKELSISEPSAQRMTGLLREGIAKKKLVYGLAEKLKLTKFM